MLFSALSAFSGRVGPVVAVLFGLAVIAAQVSAAERDATEAKIVERLQQARPDFEISSIRPSDVAGLYEVQIAGGPMLYSSADGAYFVLGDLFKVEAGGLVNLAEKHRDQGRKDLLGTIAVEDMIVFAPADETRATVTVFTDVDCFYCQKLHREVPELNRRGIAVRYLAYPRAGVGSQSYRKIASAWCADDPQKAITTLKNKGTLDDNVCTDNPVADQYLIGQQMGVQGTPAMVLDDGTMIPGYMTAADLAQRMGIN